MNKPSVEILLQIARELLIKEETLEKLDDMIFEGHFEVVRYYLLGALDATVYSKGISEERAKQFYEWLGIPSREVTRLRQEHAAPQVLPKRSQ